MAGDHGGRLIAPKEAASEWLLGTAGLQQPNFVVECVCDMHIHVCVALAVFNAYRHVEYLVHWSLPAVKRHKSKLS